MGANLKRFLKVYKMQMSENYKFVAAMLFLMRRECLLQWNPVSAWLNAPESVSVRVCQKKNEMAMIRMKEHHPKRVGVRKDKNWMKASRNSET